MRMAHAHSLEEHTVINPMTNEDLTTGSSTMSPPLGTQGSATRDAGGGGLASSGNGHDRLHRFAGTMHRAIDSIEQRLSSASGGVSSTQGRYGEQARQYGDRLRMRMSGQPLQTAGIVLAAGVLLDRLFLRKPKVRVVKVPVRTHTVFQGSPLVERRTQRWSDAADARLQRAGRTGEQAARKAGMAAAWGLGGTRAAASNLAGEADALPLRMRLATQRLMARSQEYGSMARSTVEAHPWVGLGSVIAASGLLTTWWLRRRSPYISMEEPSTGSARLQGDYGSQSGVGGVIASRPVTSGILVLGLGMLAGAMLRRRMD